MYEGTVETDVYRALRARINLFTAVVGRLQPILSSMPQRIAQVALVGPDSRDQARASLLAHLQHEAGAPPPESFDIDDAIESALEVGDRPPPAYDLEDLGRLLDDAKLPPPGCEAQRATGKDVFWVQPGAQRVAVTTDPEFFEENPESLEFWTPGSPAFPESDLGKQLFATGELLRELLRQRP